MSKIAAGIKGFAAAIMVVGLLVVADTLRGWIGVLGLMVLVGAFIRFALYGPADRLAEKVQAWRSRTPQGR